MERASENVLTMIIADVSAQPPRGERDFDAATIVRGLGLTTCSLLWDMSCIRLRSGSSQDGSTTCELMRCISRVSGDA